MLQVEGLSPEELQQQQFTYLLSSQPNSTGYADFSCTWKASLMPTPIMHLTVIADPN